LSCACLVQIFMLSDPLSTLPPPQPVAAEALFGLSVPFPVPAFAAVDEHVPERDDSYVFDPDVTRAVLAGFARNRRVLVTGLHGTGKSTHIEQIAARLNWPCIRINLDSQLTRTDLIGRDAIVLEDGKQITAFREGLLPWALQRPVALVFDEYDAGRPEVMFVIQRVLEAEGRLTLLDQNRVIRPHPYFRLFATANTAGQGDVSGLYHGTHLLNQGQMDRWHMIVTLDYLPEAQEIGIVAAKLRAQGFALSETIITQMVRLANLVRDGFRQGELSLPLSPRGVLAWAENAALLGDVKAAFRLSFANRCAAEEGPLLAEYYQRCLNEALDLRQNSAG
jgi:cobaltochelatase CobS